MPHLKTARVLAASVMLLVGAVVLVSGLSGDALAAPASAPTAAPTVVMPPDPVLDEFDLETVAALDLAAFPVVPDISPNALVIYQGGLASGTDPHTFVKVGDCMTANDHFLIPLGTGDFALGEYESLAPVIEYYSGSEIEPFARVSQAAAGGFNAASVLDMLWANPEFCQAGETPLSCEFRIVQPSVALIMFGTNDVYYLSEAQYNFYLRSMVAETIRSGVLPILSTFPLRPEFPDKSLTYNQIVVQVALDYDIPLINLWAALEPLEGQGIDPVETTHMTAPETTSAGYFLPEQLQSGFTVRNLVTLQTLAALLEAAEANG